MNKFVEYFKENKSRLLMLLLVLIGLLLVFSSSFAVEEKEENYTSLREYQKELEERLSDTCSKIKGVGKCYVTLSFERGEQNTYKGSTLVETKPPKVLGVTVICKGADSDAVRGHIVNMMSSLFDIGTNRIAVLKLN